MSDSSEAIHAPHLVRKPKKAALASWIGSALEYYDFFIYGTAAALVFNKVFFPNSAPATGTLLALATYGVGYVARPVGAFFLGHIGDKYGRKHVLILTLLLMGTATFLVGCLPGYAQVGIWAPIMLVALRLLQGFSASGEQASANSMILENAPEGRRAFYSSFTLGGTQFGQVLAASIFLPVSALPDSQLLSWGWRIPFWLSAAAMITGLVIRLKLDETPEFQRAEAQGRTARMPLAVLFRDHWADLLRVVLAALVSTVSTVFAVYALSFAVDTVGIAKTPMLWVSIVVNIVALGAIPLFAILADRIGRKPVYVFGVLSSGVLMFAYLAAIAGGHLVLIFLAAIAMSGVAFSAQNGIFPAFYGEMFPTRVRLSGVAIGTQIGFAISGFGPIVATSIDGRGTSGWPPVAFYVLGCCLVAAIAAVTARETHRVPLSELGRKTPLRTATTASPVTH